MSKANHFSCVKFRRSSTFKDSYKCKRLIEEARNRIANLSTRTKYVIRLSSEDIVQLLQLGLREKALLRVEQLYEDQHKLSAYAQIDDLCAEVLVDFDIIISKHRELTAELKGVVCTLIFAASRYGELPELNKIRNMFREWWGDELILTNVNLLKGNLVNPQIMEILTFNPLIDDSKKFEMITEIARSHNISLCFQSNGQSFRSQSEEDKYESEKKEMEGQDRFSESQGTSDSNSPYPQGTPEWSSPYTYKNIDMKMASYEESSSSRTSSEGPNQSREEEIVYLDNINMRRKSPPPPYYIHAKK